MSKNSSILKTYEDSIKYRTEGDDIIKYLSEHYIIPNDIDWLTASIGEHKKWRVEKAIKELKAKGYITAFALDCEPTKNRKDSWKLTNRGTRLAKELLHTDTIKSSTSARAAQVCCRNRNIAEQMFQNSSNDDTTFIKSDELFKNLSSEERLPFNGLQAAGYLLTTENDYIVFSLNNSNIPVYEAREKLALSKIKSTQNALVKNKFNRILIINNEDIICNIFNTLSYHKWLYKQGKYVIRKETHAVYYPEESLLRGYAFVLNRSLKQKETIEYLYKDPIDILLVTDEVVKNNVRLDEQKFGIPVQEKRYALSTVETEKFIVVNLITQELHRMSFVNDYLKTSNDNRKVLIFTTEKQKYFLEKSFENCKETPIFGTIAEEKIAKATKS